MILRLLLPAAMVWAAASSAQAAPTGREFARACNDPAGRTACESILREEVAQHDASLQAGKDELSYCAPREVDGPQLARVFLDWARDNDNQLDQPQLAVIRQALSESYPCGE